MSAPPEAPASAPKVTVADRRHRLAMGGLALLALTGLILAVRIIGNAPEVQRGGPPAGGLPPAAVYVVTVEQEDTREIATATGTLQTTARSEVAARESGAVNEVLVDEGDSVNQGDVLVRLDARRAEAQRNEAQAMLTAARSLVEQRAAEQGRAEADLSMKKGLLDRKAISRSDLLDAERTRSVATAQLQAAQEGVAEAANRLALLEIQLKDTEIGAPFDGVVVDRQVELGEWVAAGTLLITLVRIDPIEAWLRVPIRHRTGLAASPKDLRIRLSASGEILTPTHVTTVPDVAPTSQLFTVVATLDNPQGLLTPGESITGLVPVASRALHWRFSTDAVVQTPMGTFLFRVGENGTAERLAVKVAFERDGMAFVLVSQAPIRSGDQLIVEGNERLVPGQPLQIRERSADAAPDGEQP